MVDCVVSPALRRRQCEIGDLSKQGLTAGRNANWCQDGSTVDIAGPVYLALYSIGTENKTQRNFYGTENILSWNKIMSWVSISGNFSPILIHYPIDDTGRMYAHWILATGQVGTKLIVYDPAADMGPSHRLELTEVCLRNYRGGNVQFVLYV